ncbi:MAG: hypothetical protein Q8R78_04315 [Candidatus Omnitrophota bacterium]|nr:hypothetical protein [Candidatus Omnitrophota bacterium]
MVRTCQAVTMVIVGVALVGVAVCYWRGCLSPADALLLGLSCVTWIAMEAMWMWRRALR